MKPSDFFIGSREFFGALIPGLLWLVALALIFVNVSIDRMLRYAAQTNWIGVLSFAGSALLIGTLLRNRSFDISQRVDKFLRVTERSNSLATRFLNCRLVKNYLGERLAPMEYRKYLLTQAEERIWEGERSAYPNLKPRFFDSSEQLHQMEWQVFRACKRSVLARSPELGRSLNEKEAEINLIGTLPLPLSLFAFGLWLHSGDISELPLRAKGYPGLWSVGICVLALIAIVHLLVRFHAMRKEEFRMCLETFLLVEYGLAESRKENQPKAVDEG